MGRPWLPLCRRVCNHINSNQSLSLSCLVTASRSVPHELVLRRRRAKIIYAGRTEKERMSCPRSTITIATTPPPLVQCPDLDSFFAWGAVDVKLWMKNDLQVPSIIAIDKCLLWRGPTLVVANVRQHILWLGAPYSFSLHSRSYPYSETLPITRVRRGHASQPTACFKDPLPMTAVGRGAHPGGRV